MTPDRVLLDRDGTLNAPPSRRYVVLPDEARLLPGAGEAVRLLNDARVPVVVVTAARYVGSVPNGYPVWVKPVRMERLTRSIRGFLGQAQAPSR